MKKEHMTLKADPADPEDFDTTPRLMDRALKARLIRRTRAGLGLSQMEFARRFCVPPGTLRDWEPARSTPPDFAIAYMKVIARHPDMVAEEVA